MEKIILPGFFKIRNPQAYANENEPEYIKFFVDKYDNISNNSYTITLKCCEDVYNIFRFMDVNGYKYKVASAVGMEMYIRMELARNIAKFTKKQVFATEIGGSYDTENTIVMYAEIDNCVFDNAKKRICEYGDINNLFQYKHKTISFCQTPGLALNSIIDSTFFNSNQMYTVTTAVSKSDNLSQLNIPLYTDLKIDYNKFEELGLEELSKHISASIKYVTESFDGCVGLIVSEILNRFMISCGGRNVAIGLISISETLIAKDNIVIFTNGSNVEIAYYTKYDYILNGESLKFDHNLSFNKRSSKYSLEMSFSNVFHNFTLGYSKKITDIYKKRNELIGDIMNNAAESNLDNISQFLSKSDCVVHDDNVDTITRHILKNEMIAEDSNIDKTLLRAIENQMTSTDDVFDINTTFTSETLDDPWTATAINLSGVLAQSLFLDISNTILQALAPYGVVCLNALNSISITKSNDIPKLFTGEMDNFDSDLDIVTPDLDYCTDSKKNDRMYVNRTGEYVIPEASTNKNFNSVTGKLVDTIPMLLVKGKIYIYENGSLCIADVAGGPEDHFAVTLLSEYDITVMRYHNSITSRTWDPPTVDTYRPSRSNFHADEFFAIGESGIPRRHVPYRIAVIGSFNLPNGGKKRKPRIKKSEK